MKIYQSNIARKRMSRSNADKLDFESYCSESIIKKLKENEVRVFLA